MLTVPAAGAATRCMAHSERGKIRTDRGAPEEAVLDLTMAAELASTALPSRQFLYLTWLGDCLT